MLSLLRADLTHSESIEFARSIRGVEFCYTSIPQKGSFSFWNNNADVKPDYRYDKLLDSLVAVVAACGADEVAVELGQYELPAFRAALAHYPYFRLGRITYSAIASKSGGLAKRRESTLFCRWGKAKLSKVRAHYSHEFVAKRMNGVASVFDPCMGKGLTSLCAGMHGAYCYGLDYNAERLEVATSMYTKHTDKGWWEDYRPTLQPVAS